MAPQPLKAPRKQRPPKETLSSFLEAMDRGELEPGVTSRKKVSQIASQVSSAAAFECGDDGKAASPEKSIGMKRAEKATDALFVLQARHAGLTTRDAQSALNRMKTRIRRDVREGTPAKSAFGERTTVKNAYAFKAGHRGNAPGKLNSRDVLRLISRPGDTRTPDRRQQRQAKELLPAVRVYIFNRSRREKALLSAENRRLREMQSKNNPGRLQQDRLRQRDNQRTR